MSDLKYLAAYIIPLLFTLSLQWSGVGSFAVVLFAFVLVPVLEQWMGARSGNLSAQEKESKLSNVWFDYLLYFNVVIVYAAILLYANIIVSASYDGFSLVGWTLSLGVLIGANGINVAHELGHRPGRFEKFMAHALLTPALYLHFYIEHNRGHHRNVGTPLDPATARKNESLYAFWVRSISQGYVHAWHLEGERLERSKTTGALQLNRMMVYTVLEILYLAIMGFWFGWTVLLGLISAALVGILLLESINYVEHYGLFRKIQANGRFERVRSTHSWNSDHILGRIILYELTRHSDHHYMASKKYQVLDHHEESPQLPHGYPTSILMALCPPLWFKVIHAQMKN